MKLHSEIFAPSRALPDCPWAHSGLDFMYFYFSYSLFLCSSRTFQFLIKTYNRLVCVLNLDFEHKVSNSSVRKIKILFIKYLADNTPTHLNAEVINATQIRNYRLNETSSQLPSKSNFLCSFLNSLS